MPRPTLKDLLLRRRSRMQQIAQAKKAKKKNEFLRQLQHEHLEDRRMLAGLVVTEIMYDPASDEPWWEYLEVVNTDSTNTIDLDGYVIDNDSGGAGFFGTVSGANLVGPGEIAILYDAANPDWDGGWFASAPAGVSFVPVTNWPTLFNNTSGDRLGIWDSVTTYNSRDYSQAEVDIEYLGASFPTVAGVSISLSDLNADSSDGTNWAETTIATGGFTSLGGGGGGGPAPINNGNDFGSPGVVPISLSISDATVVEGNSGTTQLLFDITATSQPLGTQSFTVDFGTTVPGAGNVATPGADYTALTPGGSNQLTFFNASPLTQTIAVDITGENIVELDELLNVELSNLTVTGGSFPGGLSIFDGVGEGTIENDDSAVLTIADNSGLEDGADIGFTATLSNPVDVPITFDVNVLNDTASFGDGDFSPASFPSLSIAALATTVNFAVDPTADTTVEADETFELQMDSLSFGAAAARDVSLGSNATGTILNDDQATVSVSNPTAVDEGDTGDNPTLTFDIVMDTAVDTDVTVNYTISGVTATLGTDFTNPTSGSVTISAGSTSAPVTLVINGDDLVEADEAIEIQLDSLAFPLITPDTRDVIISATDDSAIGTINNDDQAIISITSPTMLEDDASGQLSFVVSVDNAVSGGFDVDFDSASGLVNGAVDSGANADFTAVSTTVAFAGTAGESHTVNVPVSADNTVELDEQLRGILSNVSSSLNVVFNLGGTTLTGTGTITNDDSANVTVSDVSTTEGTVAGPGTKDFLFTVNIDNPVDVNVDISHATLDVTTDGADYTPIVGGSTVFPAHTTASQDIAVVVTADDIVEANEIFQLILSGLTATGRDVSLFDGSLDVSSLTVDGTIENDDAATVTFSTATQTVTQNEGTGGTTTTFSFDVELSSPVDVPVTVNYNTNDGTALGTPGGIDFTSIPSGVLTIPMGSTTGTIDVLVNQDDIVELDEEFTVDLTAATPGAPRDVMLLSNTTQTATGEITNDDFAEISISDATVTEGDGGQVTATFTVSVDQAVATAFTVDFATANGLVNPATAGDDYDANSGTLNFAGGVAGESHTISVQVNGDDTVELDETFFVDLSNIQTSVAMFAGLVTFVDDEGLGTITNDDSAVINLDSPSGLENGGPITVTATLTNPVDVAVSVPVSSLDGSATIADGDYTAVGTTLNFAAGATTATFTVSPVGDSTVELDENLTVEIGTISASSRDVSDGTDATVTINNDDSAVLNLDSVSGNENAGPLTFTASLTNPSDAVVTVQVSTADGTATVVDNDYTAFVGQLITFNPGVTSQTFTVAPIGDSTVETDESFDVELSTLINNGRNIALGSDGTGTITNDDSATIDVSNESGDENAGPITFDVTLSNPADDTVTVVISTTDGTATTADGDYTTNSQTLTFLAGETTKSFAVAPIGDNKVELDEAFNVVVGTITNSGLDVTAGSDGVGTITNDDSAVININNVSGLENGGPLVFTATLTNPVSLDVSIPVSTADDSAVSTTGAAGDNDFAAATQTITFAAGGALTQTFSVTLNGDTVVETDEMFDVVLGTINNAGLAVTAGTDGEGTILNDDSATIDINSVSGLENGGAIDFTVTLSDAADDTVSVVVSTADDSATVGDSDYTAVTQTVTFLAGETSKTFSVTPTSDNKVELDETFDVEQGALTTNGLNITSGTDGVGTITNDDSATIDLNSVSGAEDGGPITVTATLSNPVDIAVSVDVDSADDTATLADSDYTAVSQSLTFAANTATGPTVTFSVVPTADSTVELPEALDILLSGLSAAGRDVSLGTDGVVTITNDDSATLSIDDVSMLEGTGGTTAFVFTVTHAGDPLDAAYTVDFTVTDGTVPGNDAVAPSDYSGPASTTLNFAGTAGETQTITVDVVGDNGYELFENFFVNLTSINAAGRDVTFTDDLGEGTILNDDTDLVIIGTPGDDTLTIISGDPLGAGLDTDANAANDGAFFITTNGVAGPTIPLVDITSVTFQGGDGDDLFFLDQATHGNVFNPTGGMVFEGQGETLDAAFNPNGDELIVTGMSGDLTHNFTDFDSGEVSDTSGTMITYTGLEPVSTFGTLTNINLDLNALDNEGVLQVNGTNLEFVSTNASFEDHLFSVPSGLISITDMGGADDITIDDLSSIFSGQLSVDLNTGAADIEADLIQLNGGDITEALFLDENDTLTGTGTVSGAISSDPDGTVIAGGSLTLGDGSGSGVDLDGLLDVGPHTVTLVDSGLAVLGDTTLAGGTLNGANGISFSSGDVLSGFGTIADTVNQNTATIDPQGTLNFGDGVNFGNGDLLIDVTSPTSHDSLSVTGVVDLDGDLIVTATGFTGLGGDKFVIIENDAADATVMAFDNIANGDVITVAGAGDFKFFDSGNDGNDVVLIKTFVPLPIVYVDDDFAGAIPGEDPDGAGPAIAYLVDSFPTIQEGVDEVDPAGTVEVYDGTYSENVVTTNDVTIAGAAGNPAVVIDGTVSATGPLDLVDLTVDDPGAGPAVSSTGATELALDGVTVTGNGIAVQTTGANDVIIVDSTLNGSSTQALNVVGADTVEIDNSVLSTGSNSAVETNELIYNTGAADDTLEINTTGIGGATRIQHVGNDIVVLTGTTAISSDLRDGVDTVNVAADVTATIDLTGGDPTSGSPGDTLNYFGGPVTFSGNAIQAAGVQDVTHQEFETLNIAGNIVVNGSGLDDILEITATSNDDGFYQLTTNGVPGPIVNFVDLNSFTFNAMAGNDEIIIHNPAGGVFAPLSGVVFNGDVGTDIATVDGGTVTTVQHDTVDDNNGEVLFDGLMILDYNDIEGPLTDNVPANNRIFNPLAADELIVISDNAAAGVTSYDSISGSVEILFASPSDSLTVDSNSGVDAIDVQGIDSSFTGDLTVNSPGFGDSVVVTGPISVGEVTITAEFIDINADVDSNNDDITLTGDTFLIANLDAGTGQVTLDGSAIQGAVAITASELLLLGGAFDLSSLANDVDVLAADATDDLFYTDMDDVTVGTVDGVVGIQSTSIVDITAGDDITLMDPIAAPGQDVVLETDGAIIGDGGLGVDVTADTFDAFANDGIGSITDPLQTTISNLSFTNDLTGDVVITNSLALTLDVDSYNDGGLVGLQACGTLTIAANLSAAGDIILNTKETAATDEHIVVDTGYIVDAIGTVALVAGDDVVVDGDVNGDAGAVVVAGDSDVDGIGAISYLNGTIDGGLFADLDAIQHITVGSTTSGGLVTMDTTGGDIIDGGSLTTPSVTSTIGLIANAAVEIDLTVSAPNVEASAGTTISLLSPNDDLTIGGLSAQIGLDANGAIDVEVIGTLTVDEAIDSEGGGVNLDSSNGAAINAGVTSNGGDITVLNDPAGDLTFAATGFLDTEGGAGDISVTGANDVTMADGAFAEALGGDIDITSDNGTVTLGRANALGLVTIDAVGGIIDGGDAGGADIEASGAVLTSDNGPIGTGANPLETEVSNLEAAGELGIWLDNVGDLTIGNITPLNGLASNSGPIEVETDGSMDVDEDVIANGEVTLTTVDAGGGGEWLTVRTTQTVSSATDDVNLVAGDNLTLEDSSTVSALAGTVHLSGDVASADPGIGSYIALYGTIASGSQGTVTGGPDADIIDLDPGVGHSADSLWMDGTESDDLYLIQFGRIDGTIDIRDSGTTGGDAAETHGLAPDEMFTVHNNETNGIVPQTGGFVENMTTVELVTYSTSLEFLLVHGQGGEDMFDVQPSQSTEITINGGSPTFGDPLPNGGDKLDFDSFGEYFFINGKTIETEGGDPDPFQDVNFRNIEQLPLDPLGPDTLLFDFDVYDNAIDLNLLSATEAGYTSVSQFDEYGVTGTFGWMPVLDSDGFLQEGGADFGPGSTLTQDDLLRDVHFSDDAEVFQTDIANGWYLVSAKLGSDNVARDNMRITDLDSGRVFVDDIDTGIGEYADVTFVILIEDGTLTLEFSDLGGDQFWAVASLEVRPADLLTIGTPEFNAPLTGDGETIDTLTGFEATPNTLITITATNGIVLPGQDVSPDYAGVQVLSNAAGEYTYQIQRPSGRVSSLVGMQEVTGEHTGCLIIDYEAPAQWLLDFGNETSPLEAGYFQMLPDNVYEAGVNGMGWDVALESNGGLSEGAFERAATDPTDQADARIDGHFSDDLETLTIEVAPGDYWVNVTLGDAGYARDMMNLTINGVVLADSVTTGIGEFYHNAELVSAPTGFLNVMVDDLGGDQFWVLNSLEARRVDLNIPVTFDPVAGTPTADGASITTITGAAAVPDGTLLTISSDTDGLVDSALVGTDQAVYQGVQVEVIGGVFSFDFMHPTTEGSPTFRAEAADGSAIGESSAVVTFAAPAFTRYDFNGKANDTAAGAVGVLRSDVWTTGAEFGYLGSSPNAYQRSDSVPYSRTTIPFYRDGHWQSQGTSGSRTFRFAVANPGDSVDVQVYVGDRSYRRDFITITTEDGQTDAQIGSVSANDWQILTILGATDTTGDGYIDVTFSDAGGDRYWTVVGLDVASPGGLPAAAPQLADAVGGSADSITLGDLDEARQAAIDIWAAQGATAAQLDVLRNVPIEIRDMDSHGYLGLSYYSRVLIDDNAAGAGWHLDVHTLPSAGNLDLLSTLIHEFGHQIGLDDQFHDASDVMFGRLGAGDVRRFGADLGSALESALDDNLQSLVDSVALAEGSLSPLTHANFDNDADTVTLEDAPELLVDAKRRREELDAHDALFAELDDEGEDDLL